MTVFTWNYSWKCSGWQWISQFGEKKYPAHPRVWTLHFEPIVSSDPHSSFYNSFWPPKFSRRTKKSVKTERVVKGFKILIDLTGLLETSTAPMLKRTKRRWLARGLGAILMFWLLILLGCFYVNAKKIKIRHFQSPFCTQIAKFSEIRILVQKFFDD